mmetsp:Transcript_52188/g.158559  ORF Transcript_52188/g.158559 Transcript_52188/m.158559 type:complete len:383 (+) Transcript_52188:241-1389(+)
MARAQRTGPRGRALEDFAAPPPADDERPNQERAGLLPPDGDVQNRGFHRELEGHHAWGAHLDRLLLHAPGHRRNGSRRPAAGRGGRPVHPRVHGALQHARRRRAGGRAQGHGRGVQLRDLAEARLVPDGVRRMHVGATEHPRADLHRSGGSTLLDPPLRLPALECLRGRVLMLPPRPQVPGGRPALRQAEGACNLEDHGRRQGPAAAPVEQFVGGELLLGLPEARSRPRPAASDRRGALRRHQARGDPRAAAQERGGGAHPAGPGERAEGPRGLGGEHRRGPRPEDGAQPPFHGGAGRRQSRRAGARQAARREADPQRRVVGGPSEVRLHDEGGHADVGGDGLRVPGDRPGPNRHWRGPLPPQRQGVRRVDGCGVPGPPRQR